MTISDLRDRLEAVAGKFNDAPADGSMMPEDGDYQALVRGFDFFEQKQPPGHAYLKTQLEIAHDNKYDGWRVETIHNLEDPDRMTFLKRHLVALGAPVTSSDFTLTELTPGSATLEALLDVPVEVTIRTSDRVNQTTGERYRNVYVNRRLGDSLRAESPTVPAQTAVHDPDDNIQF